MLPLENEMRNGARDAIFYFLWGAMKEIQAQSSYFEPVMQPIPTERQVLEKMAQILATRPGRLLPVARIPRIG